MFTALCGRSVRAFLIDSDHIFQIDLNQREELNAAHQMKHAILKPCIKEIQSKILKQISQIATGH